MVCDQPYVSNDLLESLVNMHQQSNHLITASTYNQVIGVPAVFSKERFADLLALDGNQGARSIINKYPDEVSIVPFPEGSFDVDTPEDLTRLLH